MWQKIKYQKCQKFYNKKKIEKFKLIYVIKHLLSDVELTQAK
jgi:hypothetical protein